MTTCADFAEFIDHAMAEVGMSIEMRLARGASLADEFTFNNPTKWQFEVRGSHAEKVVYRKAFNLFYLAFGGGARPHRCDDCWPRQINFDEGCDHVGALT